MRHLAVAEPCPMDRRPVGRRTCSSCSHFVSFRSSEALDTIGCAWNEDTVGWLRRQMTPGVVPGDARRAVAAAGDRRASAVRSDGAALAVVAAAVGIGLLLSAFNRRPSATPGRGLAV